MQAYLPRRGTAGGANRVTSNAILAASLLAIAVLIGGTMLVVYRGSAAAHEAAVDRCLSAGGAWLPHSAFSFAGDCLAGGAARRAP